MLAQLGQGAGGAFGGQFLQGIREITSALIGMAGGAVLVGKSLGMVAAGFVEGSGGYAAGWEDISKTFSEIVTLQQKVLGGGFAAQPGALTPAPVPRLRPITLAGGEDSGGGGGRVAASEAQRAVTERARLEKEIADNLAR